jgi:hypothetical protein
MLIVSLIDQEEGCGCIERRPPGETSLEWSDDPFPDCDTEPVMAFSST